MPKYVVLSQRQLESNLKYGDRDTACKVAKDHAERDGVVQYVCSVYAIAKVTQVAVIERADEVAERQRVFSDEEDVEQPVVVQPSDYNP
ncbi:MAG: hypothetical protein NWE76_01170 [Candidatus Bathyarchaeota archaeon]|nr:hypothetical protein [Candidatus Bathyarchaeota archaeon]